VAIEHPDHGGRVRLELREGEPGFARYAVTLFVADARWEATARVELAATAPPSCEDWQGQGPPPAWLLRYAHSMLAVLQRDHRDAPSARWPRRILRWRAER
jgi:hypothetical protein